MYSWRWGRIVLRRDIFSMAFCNRCSSSVNTSSSFEKLKQTAAPLRFKMNNINVLVDVCPESRINELADLFISSTESDDIVDELGDRANILQMLRSSFTYYAVDEDKGRIMAAVPVYRSPIIRSERPIYNAGYILTDPEYRSIGLTGHLMRFSSAIAIRYGYVGFLGRAGSTSRSIVPVMKTDATLLGSIPRGIKIHDGTFVDDLIVFGMYDPAYRERISKKITPPILPKLNITDVTPNLLQDHTTFPSGCISSGGLTLEVAPPSNQQELWDVEILLRRLALLGEGFALDEFTDDGYLSRRFIREPQTIVIKNGTEVVACAIFGRSTLCRSRSAPVVHFYWGIDGKYHGRGITYSIIKLLFSVFKDMGYEHVLTDCFICNSQTIRFLHRAGFRVTGSLPDCGFMVNYGLSDSLIFHRSLEADFKMTALL